MGNQPKEDKIGEMWSYLRVPVKSLASAFCTTCSRLKDV